MPEQSILFFFGLLTQVMAAVFAKEPDHLKNLQEELETKYNTTKNWDISSETSLRALSTHQLLKQLRSFYITLSILKVILYFTVFATLITSGFYLIFSTKEMVLSTVWVFIIIFTVFSSIVSFPSIFCFVFSLLIVRNKI